MRVLGIDPGLNACGWGVIAVEGPRLAHVASGTVRPKGADLGARLVALHDGLTEVVAAHAPAAAAVEATFATANGASTLKLGQARGIAMLVPARAGLVVGEYAPNAVKKAVVGAGHAAKDQIGYMVRLQLPGADPDGADAADALAVAICHALHLRASARATA
ncbi:Holliday junction endonuclease RuvC [Hasllibacter halocynthiae]|uniref:Crossover junction endodeoxyribonuclease RuvC n=1 Tax=Hasllibacter halocynthiae TaxID=595589 RepID=A0A2T0X9P7_9RHOB|nr:crossover junction endodeoxyribonuclease RuvC [Hasllibacter halocynthiae]PRY95647.1 Holliday junction endonuclease RuvC [Hasllibacter halocynthiae]